MCSYFPLDEGLSSWRRLAPGWTLPSALLVSLAPGGRKKDYVVVGGSVPFGSFPSSYHYMIYFILKFY